MKKILCIFLLTTISSAVFATHVIPVSSNECVTHISQHDEDGELVLNNCNLNDSDIPAVMVYLKAHPEIDTVFAPQNNLTSKGAVLLAQDLSLHGLFLTENNIGSEGAEAIAAMPEITQVLLVLNRVGDAGAIALSRNPKIDMLMLSDNTIGPKGVAALRNTHATLLYLDGNQVDLPSIESLSKNTTIQALAVDNTNLTDVEAILLTHIPGLYELDVADNPITQTAIDSIAQNPSIQYLNITDDHVSDIEMYSFIGNQTLNELVAANNQLSAQGIAVLASLPNLNMLYLDGNALGDQAMITLSSMRNLQDLYLDDTQITDQGFAALGNLPHLLNIYAMNNNLTDTGLVNFVNRIKNDKSYNSLSLTLAFNNIQDQGAVALTSLPFLYYLNIAYNHLSDAGIQAIKNDTNLQYYNVDGNSPNATLKTTKSNQEKLNRSLLLHAFCRSHANEKLCNMSLHQTEMI